MSRCAPRRKTGRSHVPETARSSYDGKGVRATLPASGSDSRLLSAGSAGSTGSPGSRGRGVFLLGATDGEDEKHHAHDTQHHGANAHFEIPPSGERFAIILLRAPPRLNCFVETLRFNASMITGAGHRPSSSRHLRLFTSPSSVSTPALTS